MFDWFSRKLLKLQCSNCGGKLKKVDDEFYKCPYCDTMYLVAEVRKKDSKQKEAVKMQPVSKGKIQKKKPAGWASIIAIYGSIFLIVVLMAVFDKEADNTSKTDAQTTTIPQVESEYFKEFAEFIFEKDYEEITVDEFDSVTSLSMSGNSGFLSVTCIVNGEEISFGFNGHVNGVAKGMKKFRNLTTLAVTTGLGKDDLMNFPNLTHLSCDNSIHSLALYLPHPEKLTYLTGVEYSKETEGLDKFTNLKTLGIERVEVEDISGLAVLQNLEHFSIYTYEEIKNFDVLKRLKNLKTLRIEVDTLHTIDFVAELDKLEELEVVGSAVYSIEPIRGNTNLKVLNMYRSYKVEDLAVISTLTGLERLTFEGNSAEEDAIEWEKLTELKTLQVSGYNTTSSIESLKKLPNLESLYIRWPWDLKTLSEMEQLKELIIDGMHYGDLSELGNMKNLQILQLVDLEDVTSGEAVFNLPMLRKLIISDCELEADLSQIEENRNMTELTIRYSGINSEFVNWSGISKEYDLTDEIDLVKNYPNLKRLIIRGGLLENVDFAQQLTKLEMLDITDNYVTNLDGIKNCIHLRELRCSDNALTGEITLEGYVGIQK